MGRGDECASGVEKNHNPDLLQFDAPFDARHVDRRRSSLADRPDRPLARSVPPSVLHGEGDLDAVVQSELRQHGRDMAFDGRDAEMEFGGDGRVRLSLRDRLGDLAVAGRQRVELSDGVSWRWAAWRSSERVSISRRVTAGESIAPAATRSIAVMISAGELSLPRKPEAPRRSARRTWSSVSKVVSTITAGGSGRECRRSSTASPSSLGIRRSSSMTSTWWRSRTSRTSEPSAVSATISIWRGAAEHHLQPGPDQGVVVDEQHADRVGHALLFPVDRVTASDRPRCPRAQPKAARQQAPGARACRRRAPPARRGRSARSPSRRGGRPTDLLAREPAGSTTVDPTRRRLRRRARLGETGWGGGVLARVGQRLLQDAVHGPADERGRGLIGEAVDQRDLHPGAPAILSISSARSAIDG